MPQPITVKIDESCADWLTSERTSFECSQCQELHYYAPLSIMQGSRVLFAKICDDCASIVFEELKDRNAA